MISLQENIFELANKIKNASNNVALNGYLENMSSKIQFLSTALDIFINKIDYNNPYMSFFSKIKQHAMNNNFSEEVKLYTLFYLCYFSNIIKDRGTATGQNEFNMYYSLALDSIIDEQPIPILQQEEQHLFNMESIPYALEPDHLNLSEEEKVLLLAQYDSIDNNSNDYILNTSSNEADFFIKVINHYSIKLGINLDKFKELFKDNFKELSFYSTLSNKFNDITRDPNPESQDLLPEEIISYSNKFDLILIILYINYIKDNPNFNEYNFIDNSIQFLNNYINI